MSQYPYQQQQSYPQQYPQAGGAYAPYGQAYGYGPGGMPPGGVGGPAPKRGMPGWGRALIVVGVIVLVACGGFLTFLGYLGSVGPDTKVYTGNEVPKRFVNTARELKLLEQGESIKFFYSDGLTDIRDGFYF